MAKKEQKKPAKKTQKKGTAKAKKVTAKAKKTKVPAKKTAAPKSAKASKSFSVAKFADMTYLTENGFMVPVNYGLLKGQQDAKGDWQIDASNLEVPNVKRLVR